ncbi:MAG: hypothetical protein HYY84_19385 [Deltaproteobacteria bacterium]|nr:hypothetical protein [Deltaproteobacteria bacterium]
MFAKRVNRLVGRAALFAVAGSLGAVACKKEAPPAPPPARVTPPAPAAPPVVVKDPLKDGLLWVTKASFKAGEEIAVKYTAPVPSAGESQHWVTVIAVGKEDSEWGSWKMVGDQATADTLKGQTAPGAYEVRLHGGYPAKKFNVVARVKINVEPAPTPPPAIAGTVPAVAAGAGLLVLPKTVFKAGEEIAVKYAIPVFSKGDNQHWVTVVPVGKPDTEWGAWKMVSDLATADKLKAQTAPGDYEVRIHGEYPTKKFNVVGRVRIKVEP